MHSKLHTDSSISLLLPFMILDCKAYSLHNLINGRHERTTITDFVPLESGIFTWYIS